MSRRDLSHRDASDYAAAQLEYIIDSDKNEERLSNVPSVTPQQAMEEKRVFEAKSNRNITRVLFVSRDTELLNPSQQSLDGYVNISELFDEVHILILQQGITPRNPVLRVSQNVWIYTAAAKFWWLTPEAGMRMAEEQLEFASGFRPDLVVSRDPFESAVVANRIAKKYNRPSQLHILEDYSSSSFIKKHAHNFWRSFLPRFTIPKFSSVRTLTNTIQRNVEKKFPDLHIDTLPRYQSYVSLIDSEIKIDLKDKYKPFIFFMVFVGVLDHKSTLYQILDAAKEILRNPRIGLIVLGDGPLKGEFEKKAKILGIQEQVVFVTRVKNIVPYLKSANILLVSDTDFDSEEVALKGAAAGIPMILSNTEKRSDIFTHGKSAFLCDTSNSEIFRGLIEELLNDIKLRNKFVSKSQHMIRKKFYDNPSKYLTAYRNTIEQAFFVDAEEEELDE